MLKSLLAFFIVLSFAGCWSSNSSNSSSLGENSLRPHYMDPEAIGGGGGKGETALENAKRGFTEATLLIHAGTDFGELCQSKSCDANEGTCRTLASLTPSQIEYCRYVIQTVLPGWRAFQLQGVKLTDENIVVSSGDTSRSHLTAKAMTDGAILFNRDRIVEQEKEPNTLLAILVHEISHFSRFPGHPSQKLGDQGTYGPFAEGWQLLDVLGAAIAIYYQNHIHKTVSQSETTTDNLNALAYAWDFRDKTSYIKDKKSGIELYPWEAIVKSDGTIHYVTKRAPDSNEPRYGYWSSDNLPNTYNPILRANTPLTFLIEWKIEKNGTDQHGFGVFDGSGYASYQFWYDAKADKHCLTLQLTDQQTKTFCANTPVPQDPHRVLVWFGEGKAGISINGIPSTFTYSPSIKLTNFEKPIEVPFKIGWGLLFESGTYRYIHANHVSLNILYAWQQFLSVNEVSGYYPFSRQ